MLIFIKNMEYLIYLLSIILIIVGLIGDILPGIPGVPLSYLALILLHFTDKISYTPQMLIITGVLCVVITVLDYVVPIWGTKKFGGTKAGVRGSTIGLIIGVLVLPLLGIVIGPFGIIGLLGGPFLGAYIGEKIAGVDDHKAWRSAVGSFIGFVAGTFMKVAYSLVLGFIAIKDIVMSFF